MGFGARQNVVEKFHAIRTNAAIKGIPLPILLGQHRTTAKLIYYNDFTANKAKQQGGKGLGKGGSQYVYTASIMAVLSMGPLSALLSVWDNTGKFVVESTSETTTLSGSPPSFKPTLASVLASDQGVGVQTSYSYPVDDYGSSGPTTLSGTTLVAMTPVSAVIASDTFLDSVLSPNWTVNDGSFSTAEACLQIATVGGGGRALAWWNAYTFTANQFAKATANIVGTNASDGLGVAVRVAASGETAYVFYCTSTTYHVLKIVSGTATSLASGAHALVQYDTLYLEANGTTITALINGTSVYSGTDSAIATGQPGIAGVGVYPSSNSSSIWYGGNLPATPSSGQYSVNPGTGVYTFATADSGNTVQVNYSYYRYVLATDELSIVPFSGPYNVTVQNAAVFKKDLGVKYSPSGVGFTSVSGSPAAAGQYHYAGSGVYNFYSGDAGAAIVISYEYTDPNTDNNAPQHINLTLIGGAKGQSPWSYLTSKHPSEALGYTQLAMIASSQLYLGYSPTLPNYNFEVAGAYQFGAGIVDVNPADAITAILADPSYGIGFPLTALPGSSAAAGLGAASLARACWTANSFFISVLLENQQTAASVISRWLEAGMTAAFYSEGLLKFVPYGDSSAVGNGVLYQPPTDPVADLTDDDFLVDGENDDPVKVSRLSSADAWNQVQVAYSSRLNDYNTELIYEQDDGSIQRFGQLRREDPQQWDFITTLAAAQYAASMRLQRYVYIRSTYQFRVPSRLAKLEPMDVVTITDAGLGYDQFPVRIQQITDDPVRGLTITAEDFIYGAATPAINPKEAAAPPPPPPGQADPGDTSAIVFEGTARYALQQGNMLYGFVNGSNENWGGCHVWVSFDGTNYQLQATVNFPARMGLLTANLASYGGANPDTGHTLSVETTDSTPLSSTTSAGAAAGVSECVIVSGGPTVEFLSYVTATLTGINKYNLTTLYRGQDNTTAGSHSTGDLFARLDEASFEYQFDPSYVGKTIYYKFTSFNLFGQNEQSLASVKAYSFTLAGTAGAIALDTGFLGAMSPAYAAYRPTTNPLTAIDAGSNASIVIAAFTMQMAANADINYNSATLTGLAYSTLYYVYVDDPTLAGGSASYGATTTKEDAFDGTSRFFIGSILTPAAGAPNSTGNGDGGVGAQFGSGMIFLFGSTTPTTGGAQASLTGANNAIDGDLTTYAKLSISNAGSANSNASLVLGAAAPNSASWQSLTLNVLSAVPTNTAANTNSAEIQYSLDGGSTYTTIFSLNAATRALTIDTVALPINQNLALVRVSAAVIRNDGTTQTVELDLYQAWIEGVQ